MESSQPCFSIAIVQPTPIGLIFSTMTKGVAKRKHEHIAIVFDIGKTREQIAKKQEKGNKYSKNMCIFAKQKTV